MRVLVEEIGYQDREVKLSSHLKDALSRRYMDSGQIENLDQTCEKLCCAVALLLEVAVEGGSIKLGDVAWIAGSPDTCKPIKEG